MRVLKIVLIALLALIAIPLLVALFVPKDFGVERTIEIERPVEEVFDFIKLLRNQELYSKWAEMDPDVINTYRGTDGTVGFVSRWEGNEDVGIGEQEIIELSENEYIKTELRFEEPFESVSYSALYTTALTDSTTRVVWDMTGSMPYPMNLLLLFMDIEQALGDDFDFGLNKLKGILEDEEQSS